MAEDDWQAVLARIERAIARLEHDEPPRPTPPPGLADAYARLDERHGMLRLRVQETIERLDAMIADGGARDGAPEGADA